MERSWKKTKLEVFQISWKESSIAYREALKTEEFCKLVNSSK